MSAQIYRPCIVRLIENKISQAWLVSSLNKILKKKENKHSKTKTLTREQKRGEKHHLGGGGGLSHKAGKEEWCCPGDDVPFSMLILFGAIFFFQILRKDVSRLTLLSRERVKATSHRTEPTIYFLFFFFCEACRLRRIIFAWKMVSSKLLPLLLVTKEILIAVHPAQQKVWTYKVPCILNDRKTLRFVR